MYLDYAFDYSALDGKIIEKFGNRYGFATKMGISERTMSLKMNGKVGWKQSDIARAVEILDLHNDEIPEYFFKPLVQFN